MEKIKYYYETPIVAIQQLRDKGFTIDFNLEENCIVCELGRFDEASFDIVEIYFYEGESDPGEEATVYGIESKSGIKGILVTGKERDETELSQAIIDKLLVNRHNRE